MKLHWRLFRIWLANRILPAHYVAYPVESVESHLRILAAQRDFYQLLDRHPHLSVTKTLMPEPRRFM